MTTPLQHRYLSQKSTFFDLVPETYARALLQSLPRHDKKLRHPHPAAIAQIQRTDGQFAKLQLRELLMQDTSFINRFDNWISATVSNNAQRDVVIFLCEQISFLLECILLKFEPSGHHCMTSLAGRFDVLQELVLVDPYCDFDISTILRKSPVLEKLDVSGTLLASSFAYAIAENACTHLEYIRIAYNWWDSGGPALAAPICAILAGPGVSAQSIALRIPRAVSFSLRETNYVKSALYKDARRMQHLTIEVEVDDLSFATRICCKLGYRLDEFTVLSKLGALSTSDLEQILDLCPNVTLCVPVMFKGCRLSHYKFPASANKSS